MYSKMRYYCTVQYSTVQYSTVQCSTVQYSTSQYSTSQYGTGQQPAVEKSTKYKIVQPFNKVQQSKVQSSVVKYLMYFCEKNVDELQCQKMCI